jgi:2,5-dioxopentanoate dehydrogenase
MVRCPSAQLESCRTRFVLATRMGDKKVNLTGQSFFGTNRGGRHGETFSGFNPATGETLQPRYHVATTEEVEHAVELSHVASPIYGRLSGRDKAKFLRMIADNFDAAADQLIERAHQETALPPVRLKGEVARTSNQLRLFADLVEEGSWVNARIDTVNPSRMPLPKPDIRSMLRPLGPVVVFGASNFPLAFSVAGGDTASAFAAGNPVIVKAHPAHPGTSELVGSIIAKSVEICGVPPGVFSLLFDQGIAIGTQLVTHTLVKAITFTGSLTGGRALMDLAAARPEPIPCFTEMSSTNPLFILPEASVIRGTEIAAGLHGSFTLGAGQFCTKPGLVFLQREPAAEPLAQELRKLTEASAPYTMLTPSIASQYRRALDRDHSPELTITRSATKDASCAAPATLLEADITLLKDKPEYSQEVFGPTTLVLRYDRKEEILRAAEALNGHLTATLIGTEKDFAEHADLIAILERKVGRIIFNGYPTGVEVCHAMVHGGPYPATSDSRSTSVGTQAIFRFSRPVCYQNFLQALLPEELKDENPLKIWRMVDGSFTREAVGITAEK